jgi:hypothetical protein
MMHPHVPANVDVDSAGAVTVVTQPSGEVAAYALAAVSPPAVLGGRVYQLPTGDTRWYLRQIGRACSRLLNALAGGEGDTTFSAGSWAGKLAGTRWGATRVAFVDWLNRQPGHCESAYHWHRDRGLLEQDAAD